MINKSFKDVQNICYLTLLILSTIVTYSTYFLKIEEALAQVPPSSFLVYENTLVGLKMVYPQDWHRIDYGITAGANGSVVEFDGPSTPAPSVNVFVFNSSGSSLSLINLVNSTLSQIEAVHMDPIKTMHLKDNITAYQTAYQISTKHISFEKMQTFAMKNGLIYVITYTSVPDKYLLYLPTVKRMIDTLTISSAISR